MSAERTDIITWADARGFWHARVPEGQSAAHLARHAIREELESRQTSPPGPLLLVRVLDAPTVPNTVVYAEKE